MALPIMKTPNEFIDYYYNKLKIDLGNDNIKLSKTGLMGFLLNILGNTQFDNKRYYDALFIESFPALSQDDKNLRFHANTHGYIIPMAQAATITNGAFLLNLPLLPTPSAGLLSRTISFGSSSTSVSVNSPIELDVKGIIYTVDTSYLILAKIVTGNIISYYYEATSRLSKVNGGVQISSPTIPIINAHQYSSSTHSETIPFYPDRSHYSITLSLKPTEMVYEITALTIDPTINNAAPTIMKVDTNKGMYNGIDNVIFYSILPNNSILIELGSGVKGAKILEGTVISITVKTTIGALGNIASPGIQDAKISTASSISSTVAIVTDTYSNSSVVVTNVELLKFLSPNIVSAYGGVDSLTGPSLQDGLLRHIQTRDSIISRIDYDNILFNKFKYYAVSFNKSKLSNNTISLHVPLFDNYTNLISTSTVNFTKFEFEAVVFNDVVSGNRSTYEPIKTINAIPYISPFYYKYDFLFNSYFAYILDQTKTYTDSSVISKDHTGLSVSIAVSELPNITLSLTYNHNSTAPYTIITISSYEDITRYLGAGYTSIKFTNLNFGYTTGTPSIPKSVNHISNIIKLSGIQSVLDVQLAADTVATTISLLSTVNFPLVGSVIIGTEDITYTGKNDIMNTLTGITRGANNTTISLHAFNTPVFDITIDNSKIEFILGQITSSLFNSMTAISTSLTIVDSSLFPPVGSVIIGTEEISYTGIVSNLLNGITRGVNGTVATTHAIGDTVREKRSSVAPTQSEIVGIFTDPTQIEVTLNNVDTIANTGFSNTYIFEVVQAINVNDSLQIKQYNLNGILSGVSVQVAIGAAVLTVTSTVGFPAVGILRIDNEEISYTALTTTTFTGLTRAVNGTVETVHLIGSKVVQITSIELSVPVIAQSEYIANLNVSENIISNYHSLSLPANRAISDDVQLRLLNTSYISLSFLKLMVSNGASYVSSGATALQINAPNGLLFPLKVSLSLILNRATITSTSANIISDIDSLTLTIAQELSNKFTGTRIRVSDADVIFLAKQIPYVDDANVTFTDSSMVPVNISKNEINVLPEVQTLSMMTKLERVDYIPVLWHWDINNISVSYVVS